MEKNALRKGKRDMKQPNGRCWAEVDLGVLSDNLERYREQLPAGMEVMAVVKADAYGHGDKAVTEALIKRGVRDFAVSNLDEAIRVREAGAEGLVLILGYTPIGRAEELVRYNVTQALLSEEYAQALAATGLPVSCQYALDTGMRRIGLNAEDADGAEAAIRAAAKALPLNGVFTHLCTADTDDAEAVSFTLRQLALYEELVRRIADLRLPYCHCMNSAGGLRYASRLSRFARLGIILYGLKPDRSNVLPEGIRPALAWKSVVSMVKTVRAGDTIGYGRTYRAAHDLTVATIPTGYADGYRRELSNRGHVLIRGKRAPIVGRVCMDQMMVDVSGIGGVSLGDEVVLLGKSGPHSITADDLAALCDTIGYEIVCGISKRVERTYLDGGEV